MTIQPQSLYFDFIIEATKRGGELGHISIDDIEYVRDGTCEFFNSTTTTIKPTTSAPQARFYCTFESNFCEWTPNAVTDAVWLRQNGQNAKFGVSPLSDVTYQNSFGYYAYINSYYSGNLKTAILKSPSFDNTQDNCLEFWYQSGGTISSGLTLTVRNNNNRIELWKRSGNQDDIWSHAYVTIGYSNLTNKWVEFESIN